MPRNSHSCHKKRKHCRSDSSSDSESSDHSHDHGCRTRKYKTLNYPHFVAGDKTLLTGIRGVEDSEKVYISGFYVPSDANKTTSFIYKGCICGKGKFHNLNFPKVSGMSTITNLYGPNNGKCDGTINVVGSYTTQNQTGILGCLYQGKLDNSGEWTTIIPSSLSPTDYVINTICHSNMGNLVVGNYDTILIQGKAFIYDMKTHQYYGITNMNAVSITAYGIWHNSHHSYTICGGYTTSILENFAYVVDWDNETHTFSNWQTFSFNNDPITAKITHFDGITGGPTKNTYNLTGDWLSNVAVDQVGFSAQIKRTSPHGPFFANADWALIGYPHSAVTSGNSVYKDVIIGVYTKLSDASVNGYVSTLGECHVHH